MEDIPYCKASDKTEIPLVQLCTEIHEVNLEKSKIGPNFCVTTDFFHFNATITITKFRFLACYILHDVNKQFGKLLA